MFIIRHVAPMAYFFLILKIHKRKNHECFHENFNLFHQKSVNEK